MENNYKSIREIIIKNPIYEFYGKIDSSKLDSIFKDVEELLLNKGTRSFEKKSIYVLVELLLNSYRHGKIDEKVKFQLNILNKNLYFLCENEILIEKMIKFKEILDNLNLLSNNKEELKKYYKSIIQYSTWGKTIKKIGLVDILRKSKNKILYNFIKIDDKTTMVSLITTIDIK